MSPDAELLRRYLHDRDDAAFAAIVRRHGPMVLAACRRVTANRADADDAFQATFLVLAAKAGAIGRQAQLGGWLHGVAVRCGKRARDAARRSATCPQPLDALPAAPVTPPDPDLSAVVDDALASLPDAYRAAVVLCHLEGRTRAEAARELGWSEGTLSGRLHRALRRLGERLSARGVTAAGAAALAVLSARPAEACVPLPLVASTCSAAGLVAAGFAEPGPAHSLASGVLRAMTFRKLKLAAIGMGLFGLGAFAVLERMTVAPATAAPVPAAAKDEQWKWKQALSVGHQDPVVALAVGGDLLATVDSRGGEVTAATSFWDLTSGRNLRVEEPVPPPAGPGGPAAKPGRPGRRSVRVAADGSQAVFTDGDNPVTRVEIAKGKFGPFEGGGVGGMRYECVSADGLTWLGTYGRTGEVLVQHSVFDKNWKGKALVGVEGTKGTTTAPELSADGQRVAVIDAELTVRVLGLDGTFRTDPKELSRTTLPEKTQPVALQLSGDGRRLAVTGEKGFARVYDADNGSELCELKGHDAEVTAAAFTPDGKRVATASGKTVRVFDATSGRKVSEFEAHADDVTCLAFSPDGKRLVTGSKDKSAKVWERAE